MPERSVRKPFFVRWLRALSMMLVTVALASALLVVPLRWLPPPTTAFMLGDASGRDPVLFEWTDWSQLGSSAPLAVVAAEDQKFAQHFGFDLESIHESVTEYRGGAGLRGASTITQQVAKNLYLWPGRSFLRKGIEAWFAILIELSWPKRRILEMYLNIAELGPGVYGVPAASRVYFSKYAHEISDSEAALLAAVLPNPHQLNVARPSDYVRERQRWIFGHMQRLRREGWLQAL